MKTRANKQAVPRTTLVQFLIGCWIIGLFLFLFLFFPTQRLDRLENMISDSFFRYRPMMAVHSKIVYIEIAEDSLQAIGRWPWPRRNIAQMIDGLTEWGARAVVLDVVFHQPSDLSNDQILAEALHRNGHVYLPVFTESQHKQITWIHSLPELEQQSCGIGHINIQPDDDGTLRRIQPYVTDGNRSYPHLALRIAFDYLGKETPPAWKMPFPLDAGTNLLINWAGPWKKTFAHYSFIDLLQSFEATHHGQKPLIKPAWIKDKICLIGLTALGHADIHATAVEPVYPGLGVLANVLNNILTDRFVLTAPRWANGLCLMIIGLISLLYLVPFRPILSSVACLVHGLFWISISFTLFWNQGVSLQTFEPLLLILSLFIFSAIYSQIIGHKEGLRLFHLATRDGLTGLYEIRHFRVLLAQAFQKAKSQKTPLSVILLDIDDFKKINDTYGHPAGDKVLKEVAQIIKSSIRSRNPLEEEDVAARYGGEEFIVMAPYLNPTETSSNVAERIRSGIEQSCIGWENSMIHVTASFGVATFRAEEKSPDPMIQRADSALYQAKKAGKNRIQISD